VKLVFVTQRVDADDPALGATVPKLRALAARVDELAVLALSAAPVELPANVRVRLFGSSTQGGRGVRYELALARELVSRPAAVLAHMAPIYAVLAAPLTRALRVPLLLWFTHWRRSRTLTVAERAATRVLTVDRRSFPLRSDKVMPIGHGIDLEGWPAVRRQPDGVFRLLALGRMSPAKGLRTVIEAVRLLDDLPVHAELRGPSLTHLEQQHRAELAELVQRLDLGARVAIETPLPRLQVADAYARADVLVNNMRAGALDKVVFEAAAAELPVLVASDGFDPLVGGLEPPLRFTQDDPAALADRVRALHAAGAEQRAALGRVLRERVARDHSVDHWADSVLEALR